MQNFTFFRTLLLALTLLMCQFVFSQSTARYTITFNSIWESETIDPINGSSTTAIPANAHWSNLVGATHNSAYTMVEMGTLASDGIKDVAELGNNDNLFTEVSTQISNGNADQWLQEPFSPFAAVSAATLDNILVSSEYPLLSLVAMIAPSPDWMIAVNSLNLREGNSWKNEIVLPLFAYDAGTDSGTMYTAANAPTIPREPISSLVNQEPFNANPIGFLTVTLNQVLNTSEVETAKFNLYPNPSNGLVYIEARNDNALQSVSVFDVLGKQIMYAKTDSHNAKQKLNLAGLNNGIYLIKMLFLDGSETTKRLVLY